MSTKPDFITVDLFYCSWPTDGSKPFLDVEVNPITKEANSNMKLAPVPCGMTNIRGKEAEYNLDSAGFKYIRHKSAFTNFNDDEEIRKIYYPESIELIKEHTGASKVILFDHTIRRHRPSEEETPTQRRPAFRVHVDQTPQAAINRVRRHAPDPETAEELLKHRFQILNLWRPIANPALDTPLGICDYRSLDREKDLIPTALIYTNVVGETYMVAHSPAHKWCYVRGMTPDEAVLIKCADSRTDVAGLAPHSAFIDPTTPENAPPRQSIELRALVFYDDLQVNA